MGVIEIGDWAFFFCDALNDLEFDKLVIIGYRAFSHCKSLKSISLPSVRRVGICAFMCCTALTDPAFGGDLERIGLSAFYECTALTRIAIPLKDGLIIEDRVFNGCENLSRVDFVVRTRETIFSSLHMETWRDEMKEEIDRINQTLPEIPPGEKTETVQQWIRSVLDKMEHYKTEHNVLLKEAMTLLELALWKAKLIDENDGNESELTFVQRKRARQERRITSGASIVIKNVLPFLQLDITT